MLLFWIVLCATIVVPNYVCYRHGFRCGSESVKNEYLKQDPSDKYTQYALNQYKTGLDKANDQTTYNNPVIQIPRNKN